MQAGRRARARGVNGPGRALQKRIDAMRSAHAKITHSVKLATPVPVVTPTMAVDLSLIHI